MKPNLSTWLEPSLQGRRLLLVTLTCKRAITREALSEAVAALIRKLKRRVLGRQAEKTFLAHIAVLEPTFKGGVHAHLILEDPYSIPTTKAFACQTPIAELVGEIWAGMELGLPQAQDIQPVYDLPGALKYLQKTLHKARNFDALDINNFCLP